MRSASSESEELARLKQVFSTTLVALCRTRASVADVCNSCDINRQQFAKYLNGQTLPSMFTIQKIATYFDVDVGTFFNLTHRSADELLSIPYFDRNIFSDGYYLEISESDGVENHILVGLNRISIRNNKIFYKRKLPIQVLDYPDKKFWTYEGRGYLSTDCSFIFYVNRSLRENFGAYIIQPRYPGEADLLGVKAAISTLPIPFASTILFHYLGGKVDVRHYLKNVCGVHDRDTASPKILSLYESILSLTEQSGSIIRRTFDR